MSHKTNISKTASNVVSVQLTQADATGAKGQALSNTRIYIIDANGAPTGAIMESGIAGAVPISGGGSGAPAIVPLWTAGTALDAGAQVRATVAVGGFIVGEYISSNSSRTTGATFNVTEAAFFTSVPEDTTILKKSDVVNVLTSTATDVPLSAAQGKILQDNKAPSASPALTGTPLTTTAATSTNNTQIASTAFAQALVAQAVQGLQAKDPVRVATTANITLSGAQTIDSIAIVAGNRVLVKNQTTASQNGIYDASSSAWTRAADFDGAPTGEVKPGAFCFVQEGTVNADSAWELTTDGTITIGTTALTFTQFTGAGQLTATAPLAKAGNVLSISAATGSLPGSMSAADKTKIDTVATSAAALATTGTPVMDGTAALGVATTAAKSDHVHPSDTSRAPLASPTFTGTPAAPTAVAGTNTTQLASTAFVKTAVDAANVGMLDYRGAFTPAVSSGATGYPTTGGSGTSGAINKGDVYFASAAGFILTEAIQAGDSVVAKIDSPGQTAANWDKLNVNISYVPADDAAVVKLTGAQTVAGIKTFSSLPEVGADATTSNQVVRKSQHDTALALRAPLASPTFTGTIIGDGLVRLGNGQNVGDSGTAIADATTVFPNAASTASTTIATADTALRVSRPGTTGTKWGNTLDVNIGSHTAGLNSQTQVDFRLNNGGTNVPDMTALTLRGDGQVLLNSNPTAALGAATKQYVDGLTVGLLDYRGAFTPAVSSGATGYPTTGGSGTSGAILKGDVYFASAAGFILTEAIQAGDSVVAKLDSPGQTAANWDKLNVNISYVPEDAANKRTSFQAVPTNTAYPTEKLLKDNIDIINATLTTKANALNPIPVYSASSLYPLGSQVVQASKLYSCITAITVAEAFNAAKWSEVSPTPAFATSLRLMNPTDIIEDANRAIYLLADDLALGVVSTWPNPGTGGDFLQATAGSQPTVVAVPALGNRRAALFADDFMETAANISLGTNYGLFAVFMITSLAETNQYILSEPYGGSTVEYTFGIQGSQFFAGHFNGAWRQHVTGSPLITTPYIMAASYNGANISVAIDGAAATSTAQTSNPVLTEAGNIRLGRRWDGTSDIFDGHIACVVAKSGAAFTATELAQLQGWAAWYYGRVSALPVGHTYKTVPPMITA